MKGLLKPLIKPVTNGKDRSLSSSLNWTPKPPCWRTTLYTKFCQRPFSELTSGNLSLLTSKAYLVYSGHKAPWNVPRKGLVNPNWICTWAISWHQASISKKKHLNMDFAEATFLSIPLEMRALVAHLLVVRAFQVGSQVIPWSRGISEILGIYLLRSILLHLVKASWSIMTPSSDSGGWTILESVLAFTRFASFINLATVNKDKEYLTIN